MNINQAQNWATQKLKKTSLSPSLDAQILLAFILKKDKSFLFTHPEKKLTLVQEKNFKKLISRRAKYEPIAYITGFKEFFGLIFFVNKNVLIPRTETEMIVEEVLQHKNKKNLNIIDIGSGSGAIIVALAKNIRNAKFYSIDISTKALNIAKKNAHSNKVASKIKFLKGNLLEPLKNTLNRLTSEIIITANLPYIPTKIYKKIMKDVKDFEPRLALDGGIDGLDYYRELFSQINSFNIKKTLTILIEIDPSQTKTAPALVKKYFPNAQIEIKKDLSKRERLIVVRHKS